MGVTAAVILTGVLLWLAWDVFNAWFSRWYRCRYDRPWKCLLNDVKFWIGW